MTRKLRGHVSHGHGRIGKHRKHPGGRGNAGGQHHHRINRDKYHPGFFGKVKCFVSKICATMKNSGILVNVDKLWSLIPEEIKDQATPEKAPVIDCVKAGYFKVGFAYFCTNLSFLLGASIVKYRCVCSGSSSKRERLDIVSLMGLWMYCLHLEPYYVRLIGSWICWPCPGCSPAAETKKKEEPKEESDDDMGFGLFD
uniref:Large ribosomal subunit protein uL15 n=1 Tax=Heterorhabditis bacteriophora TaxID=37862 RepID=A0A1I7X0J9_HETBA